jgi:hypothetical protein
MVVRVSDEKVRETAASEAKRATDAGFGSIALSNFDLTPGMGLIVSTIVEQYSAWKGNIDKQKDTLTSIISDIEHEETKIENEGLPKLEREEISLLGEADRDFEDTNQYKQNRAEYNAAMGRFERLRMLNNTVYPRNFPPNWLYYSGLVLIGLGDMYINYGVFLSKFDTAIALIVTIFVGFVVAATSHVHGKYLKQYKVISQSIDDLDKRKTKDEIRVVRIATGAFLICMAAIFWARYDYFVQGSGLEFSLGNLLFVLLRIAPTLFFNFLIWFVGATLSFCVHERVPGLRETRRRCVELDAEVAALKLELESRKRVIKNNYRAEIKAVEGRRSECQTNLTNLNAAKGQLEKLNANYRSQIAKQGSSILRNYAEILCAKIVQIEHDPSAIVFISPRRGRLTMLEFSACDFSVPMDD